jgi:hypothetical protein
VSNLRWARAGEAERTAQAESGQAGLRARFEREIREASPDASDTEIAKRAGNAYQAHMAMLAYRSVRARQARRRAQARKVDLSKFTADQLAELAEVFNPGGQAADDQAATS